MTEPEQPPDAIGRQIDAHCARGDEQAEAGQHKAAIKEYNAAWQLIPYATARAFIRRLTWPS